MAAIDDHIEFIFKVLERIENLRIKDTPLNEQAFVYKEGHSQGLDDAMNELRREL